MFNWKTKKDREFKARWEELKGDRDIRICDSPTPNIIRARESFDGYSILVEAEDIEGIILNLDKKISEMKKELEWALPSNYLKIELVQNVYVEEDGKIGAEFSELKLEELENVDYGYVVVTDEFNIKTIYYYGGGSLKEKTFFEPEQHYRLNATLYLLKNDKLFS